MQLIDAFHITRCTNVGQFFLFKKNIFFYCLSFFSAPAISSHNRGHVDAIGSPRSRLLAGCTWSVDRPRGLLQPGLRESRERTAFEREVNAPPGPRIEARRRLWTRCLSMPHQCALLYPVPTRLYLASSRPSSSRLALTCLLA